LRYTTTIKQKPHTSEIPQTSELKQLLS
jgi:hypothetical protein